MKPSSSEWRAGETATSVAPSRLTTRAVERRQAAVAALRALALWLRRLRAPEEPAERSAADPAEAFREVGRVVERAARQYSEDDRANGETIHTMVIELTARARAIKAVEPTMLPVGGQRALQRPIGLRRSPGLSGLTARTARA